MPKQTCLHLRAGVRARDGNRLANQVLNTEILRVPTPLCLAERLAEIYSFFRIFGYVFDLNGAPTRTRTADLLITNYMAPVFIGFHQYSFHPHIP